MRRKVLWCGLGWMLVWCTATRDARGQAAKTPQTSTGETDVRQLRGEMAAVEEQMRMLQASLVQIKAKLDAVEARSAIPAGTPANGSTPGPAAVIASTKNPPGSSPQKKPMVPREVISQDLIAAPRLNNVPYGAAAGEIAIPGTNINLRLGGFARVDLIHDLKPAGFPTGFIPSSIPIGATLAGHDTRLDVNQSRISMDIRRPTKFGSLRVFYQNDFFGGTTTDPVYHLLHLYGQLGNVLAGYTYTTFLDVDAAPETLDSQGPNGSTTGSAAQIRYTRALGRGHSVAVGAEGAVVDVDASSTDAQFTSQIPDFALRYRYDGEKGHLQFSSLFRDIEGNVAGLIHPHVFGWGITAAGAHSIFERDTALYQLAYGSGIGHYLADVAGSGSDVAIDSSGDLVTLPAFGGFGGYQHYWTPSLRSTLTYGYSKVDNTSGEAATSFHSSHYAAANLIWNLDQTISVGGEFLYGRHTQMDRSGADASRLQLSIQYDLFPVTH